MAKVEERKVKTEEAFVTPGGVTIPYSEIVTHYRIANKSRIASVIGRREVLTGKAKFGIFGDGKEVAQLAMATAFRPGDWRAGYYRDQTFMLAAEMMTLGEFFGQLYADTDLSRDPASGGRQMVSHFATRFIDDEGAWVLPQTGAKHSSSDISPTAGQMARMLGLAYTSKLYRSEPGLSGVSKEFSESGNEVVFGTIGNASTSEGVFFETVNAAGVLQVPLLISVWDDGYGISVPNEYQTTHSSISEALKGFQWDPNTGTGLDFYLIRGWDYPGLLDAYSAAAERARQDHVPALIHVIEMTQPQGHSTSGSHERYKSKERLAWEEEYDCIAKMRAWMIDEGIASAETLDEAEAEDRKIVQAERRAAWDAYMAPIEEEQKEVLEILGRLKNEISEASLQEVVESLRHPVELNRKAIHSSMVRALAAVLGNDSPAKSELAQYLNSYRDQNRSRYNSHLYSRSGESPLRVDVKPPKYSESSEIVDGRVVLLRCFDANFKRDPRIFVVGEDVGKLGDVNLVFEGLQEKHGELRLADTGIREATIFGQGIGAAMRGLRPVVDIQYLDYFLFALQGVSDDLATLHYRTVGGQKAPVVIRTKGHRLQGIWHTGSPMAVLLHSLRGIYLCVPRNMTQAAGMYNTLFRGDNPGVVIEVLSGYRLKERVPDNVGTFTVPLGVPATLREGSDITIVTYAACCRIAMEAASDLSAAGIEAEVIDVQTLNPFDVDHTIVRSLEKTNTILFLDEDVPGGASAYMMHEVLEAQGGWQFLDAPPRTLAASDARSAFAVDGDYYTKPNREEVFEAAYVIVRERRPADFPPLYP